MLRTKEYLEKAFLEMNNKDALYQSTSFWKEACKKISKNTNDKGLKNFRNEIDNLHFFVPTYGYPGNSFSEEGLQRVLDLFSRDDAKKNFLALEKYLSGDLLALADYRVFKAANKKDDALNLLNFSESAFGSPSEHFEIEGCKYSRSALNYLLGLSLLKSTLPDFIPQTVLEIGGGFGTLGEILNQIPHYEIKYIDIDLPPVFFIASEYIRNACSLDDNEYMLSSLNDSDDVIEISELPRFSFLPSWEIEKLKGKIDLFVNFISFQEMEPDVVSNYLSIVSSLDAEVILLRNIKEGKQKATGGGVGVITPIVSDDYATFLPNYSLVDTNTIPFGYTTVDDFNSELLVFKKK